MARQLSCDNSRLVAEEYRIIIDIENYSNLPHGVESWVQHRWVVRFFVEFIVAWKWRAKHLYTINGALNYKWDTRKLQNSLSLNRTRVLCVFVCICKYTASIINAIFIIQSEIWRSQRSVFTFLIIPPEIMEYILNMRKVITLLILL